MNTERTSPHGDRRRAVWNYAALSTEPTASTDPAEAIRTLRAMAGLIDDEIAGWVAVMRANGQTWEQVALALGMTRQAAHQRYSQA